MTRPSHRRGVLLALLGIGFAGFGDCAAEARSGARKRGSRRKYPRSGRAAAGSSSGSDGSVSFGSCREARAAGYSRIRRGDPGYATRLDRDGDGIACE